MPGVALVGCMGCSVTTAAPRQRLFGPRSAVCGSGRAAVGAHGLLRDVCGTRLPNGWASSAWTGSPPATVATTRGPGSGPEPEQAGARAGQHVVPAGQVEQLVTGGEQPRAGARHREQDREDAQRDP